MPVIPLSRRAGNIEHVRAETAVTGGNQSIRYYGNDGTAAAFAGAANKIGGAVQHFGKALKEYTDAVIDTENKLAATEAENLYEELQGELTRRMTENPGSYREFEVWARETDKLYEEKSQPIRDRMSENFRKQFDASMQNQRIQTVNKRREVGLHSVSSALYNNFQAQYKQCVEHGRFDAAQALLELHRGKLISPEEYNIKKEIDLPMRKDFFDAKRAAENNPAAALKILTQKDSEGNYTAYTHLAPDVRRQVINYTENLAVKKENEMNDRVLAAYTAGQKLYNDDTLNELHRSGAISDKQFILYSNWNKAYDRNIAAKKTAAENARKALKQQQINAFMFKGFYNPDGTQKTVSAEDAAKLCREGIEKIFGNDYDGAKAFCDSIWERAAKSEKIPDWTRTPNGSAVKDYLNTLKPSDFYSDPWGLGNKKDSEEYLYDQQFKMWEYARTAFERNKGDVQKTIADIKSRLEQLNDGKISDILQNPVKTFDSRSDKVRDWDNKTNRQMNSEEIARKKAEGYVDLADTNKNEAGSVADGEVVLLMPDGKRAVFNSKTKKFVRWAR